MGPPTSNPDGAVRFQEVQRFGPWWLWLLVAVGTLVGWGVFVVFVLGDDRDSGTVGAVATLVVLGVVLPVLFLLVHLDVTVVGEEIRIRFFPFPRRTIARRDVAGLQVRRYHPLKEYGGWGIKGWTTKKIAYNVKGDEGVDLTMHDGRTVLIGSQRSAELAEAISAMGRGESAQAPS